MKSEDIKKLLLEEFAIQADINDFTEMVIEGTLKSPFIRPLTYENFDFE